MHGVNCVPVYADRPPGVGTHWDSHRTDLRTGQVRQGWLWFHRLLRLMRRTWTEYVMTHRHTRRQIDRRTEGGIIRAHARAKPPADDVLGVIILLIVPKAWVLDRVWSRISKKRSTGGVACQLGRRNVSFNVYRPRRPLGAWFMLIHFCQVRLTTYS